MSGIYPLWFLSIGLGYLREQSLKFNFYKDVIRNILVFQSVINILDI